MIAACLFSLLVPATMASAPQDFPSPRGYVNDFSRVIDAGTTERLTALCQELEQKTGAELTVVTVATVGDYDFEDYSNRLFERWGIGKRGKDNGVMLFLTTGERRVRIEVGYGLEGPLPDITAGRLLDTYVLPDLRRGDYSAGLWKGAQAIAGVIAADAGVEISGAVRPELRQQRDRGPQGRSGFSKILMVLFILMLLFRPRWLWPLLLMGMGGRGRGGRWGGFGGGFGGGGFGGFGGGGGGGGGASRGF